MKPKYLNLRLAAALTAALLCGSAFAADNPPQDKPGKFAAIGDPTLLIICQVADFPGGIYCAAPISLGQIYSYDALAATMVNTLGCFTLGSGVFNCAGSTQVPGVFLSYTYAGTNDVSRVIYIQR